MEADMVMLGPMGEHTWKETAQELKPRGHYMLAGFSSYWLFILLSFCICETGLKL